MPMCFMKTIFFVSVRFIMISVATLKKYLFFWSDLNCIGETFVTLQAMLQSHDEVLKISTGEEVNQYHVDTSTGYNGRIEESMSERPEKLTRVRLVQFHKNLNEPMVRMQVHALRPYR